MSWEAKLKSYRDKIEAGIQNWLPAADTRPVRIHQAVQYSMAAGGKRIRPVLVMAASELFEERLDPIPAAVAVECLHTYSLIHDDLPSMDDSPLRRGRPSCHIKFDEATAVLAGDALLTESFAILAKGYTNSPVVAHRLVLELADAAGSQKLIGGQMADIEGEEKLLNASELDFIHLNKTAALLSSCIVMGMLLTNADQEDLEAARIIGKNLGLAFQIVDDILDAISDTETLGKQAGLDGERNKNTYPALHGLESSQERVRELTNDARKQLNRWENTDFLEALFTQLESRLN